jgi:hypothetical protein
MSNEPFTTNKTKPFCNQFLLRSSIQAIFLRTVVLTYSFALRLALSESVQSSSALPANRFQDAELYFVCEFIRKNICFFSMGDTAGMNVAH